MNLVPRFQGDETAIKGVLWSSRGAWITLRGAEYLQAHGTPKTVDGEVVLHRAQILFIQVLPGS